MKNAIKRMLVKMVFTAEERNMIMRALDYSEYKYKKHGNYDKALHVGIVKSHIKRVIQVQKPENVEKGVTLNNVEKIIHRTAAITGAYVVNKFRDMFKECDNEPETEVHVQRINPDECAECEHKEKCFVYNVILKRELQLKERANSEKEVRENETVETPEPEQPSFEESQGEQKVDEQPAESAE